MRAFEWISAALLWTAAEAHRPFPPRPGTTTAALLATLPAGTEPIQEEEKEENDTLLLLNLRGGGNVVVEATKGLQSYMSGSKTDTLLLLLTTAFNTPLCQKLQLSPILGFLATGVVLGPNGQGWIKNVHGTELLADIGIVFFLFEMGIHLSFKTLMSMRTSVFGLGGSQFAITATLVAGIAMALGQTPQAAVILGGGLALSSSAFVLQLLKDKNQLTSEYGKSSFGVLLLQDLMVVPLLVITPLLAGGGDKSLASALTLAGVQLTMALSVIGALGKYAIGPLFDFVVASTSQEAMVGLIVAIVLGFSYLTEGLGLSNTLGPFLAGVLLAESKYKHEIEEQASPIRGILVGLFFFTVGFEIDIKFILAQWHKMASLVGGVLVLKSLIAFAVGKLFGLDTPTARHLGLVLSQGGEFAFVAFRAARSYGILSEETTKTMLTVVSLTMAATPALEDLGARLRLPAAATMASPPPSPPQEAQVEMVPTDDADTKKID
jgi:monovalent cation:H+ antiporter-2, CPA2 family